MNLHKHLNSNSLLDDNFIQKAIKDVFELNKDFTNSFKLDETKKIIQCYSSSPQEIHPYLNKYKDKMPSKPTGMIIGTFPPASYLLSIFKKTNNDLKFIYINSNELKSSPLIDFYHGNKNSLWEFLGVNQSLSIINIIKFLNEKKWAYTDIVLSCSRKKITDTKDIDLQNVVPNFELIDYLNNTNTITHLWFTSSGAFNQKGIEIDKKGQVKISGGQAYNIFLRTLQLLEYDIEVSIDNKHFFETSNQNKQILTTQFKNITCHYLKFKHKIFKVYTGPSPSNGSNIPISRHPKFHEWINLNEKQNIQLPTIEFRKQLYKSFIDFDIKN
jgi:hypothetical protein